MLLRGTWDALEPQAPSPMLPRQVHWAAGKGRTYMVLKQIPGGRVLHLCGPCRISPSFRRGSWMMSGTSLFNKSEYNFLHADRDGCLHELRPDPLADPRPDQQQILLQVRDHLLPLGQGLVHVLAVVRDALQHRLGVLDLGRLR